MPSAPLAFVAGATGYTGRSVVSALRALDVPTVAHVRPDSPRLGEWRGRFEALGAQVDTTAWDRASFSRTFAERRPGLLFALLGTTRARARRVARETGRIETYDSVDLGLTLLLIECCVAAGLRPRFVYQSSMGVRAGTGNAYLEARWKVEQALRASGLPYVIARPGIISGPDRDEPRPLERAAAVTADAVLGALGALGATGLRRRWRSTTGDELARALVRLALDPAAEGRVVEPDGLKED